MLVVFVQFLMKLFPFFCTSTPWRSLKELTFLEIGSATRMQEEGRGCSGEVRGVWSWMNWHRHYWNLYFWNPRFGLFQIEESISSSDHFTFGKRICNVFTCPLLSVCFFLCLYPFISIKWDEWMNWKQFCCLVSKTHLLCEKHNPFTFTFLAPDHCPIFQISNSLFCISNLYQIEFKQSWFNEIEFDVTIFCIFSYLYKLFDENDYSF